MVFEHYGIYQSMGIKHCGICQDMIFEHNGIYQSMDNKHCGICQGMVFEHSGINQGNGYGKYCGICIRVWKLSIIVYIRVRELSFMVYVRVWFLNIKVWIWLLDWSIVVYVKGMIVEHYGINQGTGICLLLISARGAARGADASRWAACTH